MYNCCRNRARFWHRDSNSGSLRYSSSFWPLVSLFLLVKANISHFVFSLDKMPNNCLESSLLNFNQTAALLSLVHLDGSYIEFSNLFFHMFINIMTCFFPPPRGGKFWKRWEYQTTWPAFWEICMQVRKQQLELDMEQQTGSKEEKEYIKAVYYHPDYLTYMQSTSWETLGWMKHKLHLEAQASRLMAEISITSDMQMTPPLWQKAKKN